MGRADFLYSRFREHFAYEPTECQDNFLRQMGEFLTGDDGDILILNGYAGTGKTTAVASVVAALKEFEVPCVLLAPTGRAAKVLSMYTGQSAYTIHKQIYRQKSVSSEGFGQFSLAPNKSKDTLFVVDEVSLIGIDSGSQQSTAMFGTGNLLEDLVNYVRNGTDCRLVMIGDAAQLPPVGHEYSPALAKEYMDAGKLVPDEVIIGIIHDRLDEDDCKNGYILDGFPRTIPQAESLTEALAANGEAIDFALNVDVPDANIVNRMAGRRACLKCGATYHIQFAAPKKEGICDKCGSELVLRDDDKPETVQKRLEIYHDQTHPLIEYYEKKGVLHTVDGTQTMEDVFKNITDILGA